MTPEEIASKMENNATDIPNSPIRNVAKITAGNNAVVYIDLGTGEILPDYQGNDAELTQVLDRAFGDPASIYIYSE